MRFFPQKLRIGTGIIVLLSMCILEVTPALAGLASSQRSGTTTITSSRDADMLVAQRALENRIVAQKLRDYGLTPEAAQLRLATLSDQDLHTLASATRGLPSGGDGTGVIISLLVIAILVIVLLRLLNKEVIIR